MAESDHSGDNDRLWDVARGASSLVVSSLAALSNSMSSGSILCGVHGVWSSKASILALSLDASMMYYWYTLRYPYWYHRCSGSLESPKLWHLWDVDGLGSLGERGCKLVIMGVSTCMLT